MSTVAPVYLIAWRLPWWVLAQIFRALLVAVVAMGWGLYSAKQAWRCLD